MDITNYYRIPPVTLEAMKRYTEHRIPTGSFLQAVISNDLQEAVLRADRDNMPVIPIIAYWFYMEAPSQCHGSIEKYNNWIKEQ